MKIFRMFHIIPVILYVTAISGCSSSHKGAPIISNAYNTSVRKNILVVPPIDARSDNNVIKDIKELKHYQSFYNNAFMKSINKKGYSPIGLSVDVNKCPSLRESKLEYPINCFGKVDNYGSNIVLLVSIDEYIPPKSYSMTATAYSTGIIYDLNTNIILWKNSVMQESGNEVLIFGPGGYIGGLLAKSVSSQEISYEGAAYGAIKTLLETLPQCPDNQ